MPPTTRSQQKARARSSGNDTPAAQLFFNNNFNATSPLFAAPRASNFVPVSEAERPKCTRDIIRESRMKEEEYKMLVVQIAKKIRLRLKTHDESVQVIVRWARRDAGIKDMLVRVYNNIKWIGKSGCRVSRDTKMFMADLVRTVQASTGKTSTQAKQSTYSRYSTATKNHLIDLIISIFVLPRIAAM